MSCENIESQIQDYHENQLNSVQRIEVETHLSECARCRAFARQLFQLDSELSAAVKIPALSADFNRRLHAGIQDAPSPLSETERVRRKRKFEAEFEAGRARIDQSVFSLDRLLRYLLGPVVAIVAGWLVWRLTVPVAIRLNPQSLDGMNPTIFPWLAASVVFLAITLPEVFPRRWKSA